MIDWTVLTCCGGVVDEGWDDFSEFGFIHNILGATLNVTDLAGARPNSYWDAIYESTYFTATSWKTIDKGLQRLPDAIYPLVKSRLSFGRHVGKSTFDPATRKVTLSWKTRWSDKTYKNNTFDYAVVSAPFSVVRGWRFSPPLPSLITRAVNNLHYANACKVALHFKTRFWEHLPRPIFGGCSYTDIPGVQYYCYPSYAVNSTGPGVLLANYIMDEAAELVTGMSESEHVQLVLDAVKELHGEDLVDREYSGKWNRQCWALDGYARAGWANPLVGDHKLYIPEYFRTVNGMVWVGEHTSYTQAWIASALESAVRGTVQLLLELGLVDEAKTVTKQWMGRWIRV